MPTVPHTPESALLDALRVYRALAAPHRFRVIRDTEGWPLIPGKLGQLEWHDETALAVYTDRPRVFARLWTVPGVRRWQVDDQEVWCRLRPCRRREGSFRPAGDIPSHPTPPARKVRGRRTERLQRSRIASGAEADLDRWMPTRDGYSGAFGITTHTTA